MKSKWKMLIWIFSVLVFTGAFSPKWKVDAASTYVMNVGEKMNLRLTGTVKGTVQWKISNKSVARLSPIGKRTAVVMAKKEGNVRVTAKAGGRAWNCRVRIKSGIGTPKLRDWVRTYASWLDPNPFHGDGQTWTATWSAVKGADGYQVEIGEKCFGDKWGYYKRYMTKRTVSVGFSDMDAFRARVRAYKSVRGKKVFGKWSNTVIKKWENGGYC